METASVEPADASLQGPRSAAVGRRSGPWELRQGRLAGCLRSPQALTTLHSQDAALCLLLKTGGLGELRTRGLGSTCSEGRPNAGLTD